MSDEDKRKYIEEIFKYCKIDSILVISKSGQLQRLDCPFEVLVIQDVGELYKGLKPGQVENYLFLPLRVNCNKTVYKTLLS